MPFGKGSFRTADSARKPSTPVQWRGPVIAGHMLLSRYTRLSRLQIRYPRHLTFVKIDDACARSIVLLLLSKGLWANS
ncbi:unnamed protein product [Fusarium venenatum]|uniref:Uncharacterized protein n=1 Tax=Fusarium venenatum TaxID=56646 RepID=A0A2L2T0Y4_9HYPO|nr:uncharacterized protein FVRRES_12334 [Fusarium venenatum]CEI39643.1 unnamed protein product [Fusarium venenatum]